MNTVYVKYRKKVYQRNPIKPLREARGKREKGFNEILIMKNHWYFINSMMFKSEYIGEP